MMTKYGVVGTGYFGAELARFMSKVEGAKITAIYDPVNAAPIAKELNCVATATMEALCTHPDVDCVIIASPNYLHKAPVIAAAKAGKHVFCEKPIALNYQDCKDMVDACKEAGVTFAHRSSAFDAGQFIMDYLKTRAPFWKREATPEGDRWV
ncbi:Gfo/Idh/MocA family oxidoreductase, partial [Salmonella enterica subsp. enterica serovar Kentucky]|nr:Gfo/Idh/MocA family oxidoreductase [Salmonella enterica subsp. enterica serovar Kentucky]